MKRKREKGYWLKRAESFPSGEAARSRAGILRRQEHCAHVVMKMKENEYVVYYSIAKWYVEALKKAGVTL